MEHQGALEKLLNDHRHKDTSDDHTIQIRQESRIRQLERTLRTLNAENKKLLADNEELRKKCAEHYANCQKLIRYEFKTQAKEQRSTFGVVSGKNVTFELDAKNNNEARILPALPDELK